MDRRHFLSFAGALASGASSIAMATAIDGPRDRAGAPRGQPASPDRPNILVIISDQHRAGLSKRAGYSVDTTPALDRRAAGGIDFARAYCTMPECVPSRISLLTGRWPDAHRVRTNPQAQSALFTRDLYQVAREQGYRTGLAGKNHSHLVPDDLDFWREYSHLDGYIAPGAPPASAAFEAWLKTTEHNVVTGPTPFPPEVQHPYRIVSDAIDFMQSAGSDRFLLQLSFPEPHNPEQVPHPYWDMFPPDTVPARRTGPAALARMGDRERWLHDLAVDGFPELEQDWRRYVSNYLGALRMIDDQMRRLFDFMDGKRLLDNTVVVVLADHGDYMMDYGLARKGVGLPECLTRIPMTWFGAGIRPDRKAAAEAHVSMADVMPTLCEMMNAPIPDGVQGRSLLPLLRGESWPADEFRSVYASSGMGGLYYEAADRIPVAIARGGTHAWDELNKVTQSGNAKMVRMGDWKLVFDMMGNGQLYNLTADPAELNNLFDTAAAADARNRLTAELLMWTIRNQDVLPIGAQNDKYRIKWPGGHNWYAPYRRASIGTAFRP